MQLILVLNNALLETAASDYLDWGKLAATDLYFVE